MLLFDFSSLISELCDYYERKEPKQGTKDLWFEKVKSIPKECLPWIVKKICSENEAFPKNLPGVLAAMFFNWRESHPDKIAHERRQDCPDCDDETIRAWKIGDNNRPYSYLFRCARCKQSTIQAWPLAYRAQLYNDGYEPEPKNDVRGPSVSVRQLAKQVADAALMPENVPF